MNTNLFAGCSALLVAFISAQGSYAQGTFQNLDFESAEIIPDPSSPYYPAAVNATNALPGWTALGGVAYPDVLYNAIAIDSPAVSIHDRNDPGEPAIQGNYSVYLQGGIGSIGIEQTGQIPITAESITFWSYYTGFQLTFGGNVIPYVSIGSGPNYTIYGGDVSAFAGHIGQLRFSGNGFLDNIQFSNLPVPEPGVFGLSALGALLLGWRVLWRR